MAEKPPRPSTAAPAKPAAKPAAPATPVAGMQYRNLALVALALAALWALAIASRSRVAMIVLGVLTTALVAGGIYLWRWAKKQRELMELIQGGSASPEARKAAIAQLSARESVDKDVMNLVARAQLEAQDDPDKALATLEQVDLKKVPAMAADEVRAFRAQLYLANNRPKDAADLADAIQVSRAQQPESRGLLAATVAEAWARTGKHKEALDLLHTFQPDDKAYEKTRVPLLYARIFANFAAARRDLVRKDMLALCKDDPNLLGRFILPKFRAHPELIKMARDIAMKSPEVRKMAGRMGRPRPRGH